MAGANELIFVREVNSGKRTINKNKRQILRFAL